MKIIKYIANFLFGFSECSKCIKSNNCDMKPWLHTEKDCNYNVIHGRDYSCMKEEE